MSDLFSTGIRPTIDEYLTKKAAEERDYGSYWSASSAGYCMRLQILRRLKVPAVPEIQEDAMRTQRVFEVGHIFHEWAQRITRAAGLSIAQELELQDEDLMVRGHTDDIVLTKKPVVVSRSDVPMTADNPSMLTTQEFNHLILYDYKTANSQAFNYKRDEIGHYHKMQLGTYMYMLRGKNNKFAYRDYPKLFKGIPVSEGRILTISKDDLRMREHQLLWSDELADKVVGYWHALNGYWEEKVLPPCTCLEHDGGFMGRRSSKGKIYNDYFYHGQPCSAEWAAQFEQAKEFIKQGENNNGK